MHKQHPSIKKPKSSFFKILVGSVMVFMFTLFASFLGLTLVSEFSEDSWRNFVDSTKNVAVYSIVIQLTIVAVCWVFWDSMITARGKTELHRKSLASLRNPLCLVTGFILLLMVV